MTIPKIIAALVFIALNYYAYHFFATTEIIPERLLFSELPNEFGEWQCRERQDMDEEIIQNLGVTDYLICDFYSSEGDAPINLYVGYHERQQRSDSGKTTLIHPPEHCLPGSGWDIIESEIVDVDFGIPGQAKRVVIAKGDYRSLVYFWYQSRGRVIAKDTDRIAYMFIDRATRSRTDGSLVRFTVNIERGDVERADQAFQNFAMQLLGEVEPFLPN